jgi:hypothetical protein
MRIKTLSADAIVVGHRERMRAFDLLHYRMLDALVDLRLDIARVARSVR